MFYCLDLKKYEIINLNHSSTTWFKLEVQTRMIYGMNLITNQKLMTKYQYCIILFPWIAVPKSRDISKAN